MRPKWGRWYAFMLVGLCGGLFAWFFGMLLFKAITPNTQQARNVLTFTLIQAAFFGMVIGGLVSLIDGWWDDSWWEALKSRPATFIVGCFLGTMIAITGHFLGYTFYEDLSPYVGPLGGRLLGFGVAGLVGLIDGIHHQSGRRMRNGAIGGFLGGLIAGLLYHLLAVYIQIPIISANTLAFAFPLWGAGVLLGVSTTNWVASEAFLAGLPRNESPKYRNGFTKLLYADQPNNIGASPKCTFKIAMDHLIMPLHATILQENGKWYLLPKEDGALLTVNEQEIHQRRELRHGDTIVVGQTAFQFQHK